MSDKNSVMVPRESTEAMLQAGAEAFYDGAWTSDKDECRDIYAAMIAAAPAPPTGLTDEEVEALARAEYLTRDLPDFNPCRIALAALRRTAQPDAPKPEVDDAMVERALRAMYPFEWLDACTPTVLDELIEKLSAALRAALGSKG